MLRDKRLWYEMGGGGGRPELSFLTDALVEYQNNEIPYYTCELELIKASWF